MRKGIDELSGEGEWEMELTLEPGTTIRNIHNGVDYTVVEFGPFVQMQDGGGCIQMYWRWQDVGEHFVEVEKENQ
jgi:hypothetical protein